eukprot:COSAG06_NODE_721_length_12803_cov_167.866105_1_plen_236_part_10
MVVCKTGFVRLELTARAVLRSGLSLSAGEPQSGAGLEQVLEAPGLQGPIRLCICMYNGGKFTLLPDPLPEAVGIPAAAAAATAAGGAEAGGGADTLTAQAGGSGGSSAAAAAAVALPLSAKLSLGAMYAVLRQAVKKRIRSLSLSFAMPFSILKIAAAVLPRQARDKHNRESSTQKEEDLACVFFFSYRCGATGRCAAWHSGRSRPRIERTGTKRTRPTGEMLLTARTAQSAALCM